MKTDRNVDFYITSFRQIPSANSEWLICKESLSHCVAVEDDLVTATVRATQMAEFEVSCGQLAQVHVQDRDSMEWHTVWCSPGDIPRFAYSPAPEP